MRFSPLYKVVLLIAVVRSLLASSSPVSEALNKDWLLSSLLGGSGLANRNLFNIAFEPEGPHGVKRVWVASSDGLRSYDGYSWHRYSKSNGLPSDFVRCVLVTRTGQLWVGTDRGAGVFDGRSFASHGAEQGMAGLNVRRIIEDADGTLWFCSDSWPRADAQGGIASFSQGRWHAWHVGEGLPSNYVVNYFRNSEGRQFAVTSAGLAELRDNRWVTLLNRIARPGLHWGSASIAESPAVGMMVSTGTDVFVLKNGAWKAFTNTRAHESTIIATLDGKILACGYKGPNRKEFVEWERNGWRSVSADFPVTHDHLEEIKEAPDGSIYAVGFDCLRRWERRGAGWQDYPGLPRPRLLDGDGRIWSMDERGFFRYSAGKWLDLGKAVTTLANAPDGSVWGWNQHTLTHWSSHGTRTYTATETGLHTYLSVDLDAGGHLWVWGKNQTGQQHLLTYDGKTWAAKDILGGTWLASAADPVSGMWYLTNAGDGTATLVHISDQTKAYSVPSRLLSRYTNQIHADQNGNVWLFGETGLHRWRSDKQSSWESIDKLPAPAVIACVERKDELWFAVDGTLGGSSGLVKFSHENWHSFNTDPILSWSSTKGEDLLFGSKGRFYVISRTFDGTPLSVQLPEPDQVISLLEDHDGSYWLGTSEGILVFHSLKTPPHTFFVSYDQEVLQGEEYRARVRGQGRFRPPNVNPNFAFSWRFDDGPWSAFDPRTERSFNTAGWHLGKHQLQARSRDNAMNIDPMPVAVPFQIHDRPIQERRWFVPALISLACLLLSLSLATASAHWRLARQARHLENTVAARTAELRLSEENMRQSNRVLQRTNEDLRQFAWAASHDLQEPLRMVVTYTQFLSKRYSDKLDETGRDFISFAVNGAYRMQTLLQALLEYWQVNERADSAPALVESATALEKALGNLELAIRESQAVISYADLPALRVSESALVQLFQNLIANAIKYRKPTEVPRISIRAEHLHENEWSFSVRDNGIGIAPEHKALVFKLFKRLHDNQQEGTGIGLAICAKVVENMGGKLWVESVVGQGSTFFFTVPDSK